MREADESLIGRTIAQKYVILSILGSGAMGCVYKARQTPLDKLVAVKVMHPGLADDAQFAARFKREAKAASKLDHPSSIRIIDYGEEDDGLLYISMEYVEGRSLLQLVHEEWPLAPARVANILAQVCAALALAHDQGIIHRDVKPENILVASTTSDEGERVDAVKVCDFGIAKIADPRAYQGESHPATGGPGSGLGPLTRTGAIVGTPEYMSPEQGRGDPLDARSDVYSVGVILFQMLTGKVPFQAESAIGVILKHITDAPLDPLRINPMAHARLAKVALKAMSKRPDERYAGARDLRAELRAAVDGDARLAAEGAAAPRPSVMSGPAPTMTAVVSSGVSAPSIPDVVEPGEELEIPATPRWKIAAALALVAGLVGGGAYVARGSWGTGGAPPASSAAGEAPLAVLEPNEPPLAPLTYKDGGARAHHASATPSHASARAASTASPAAPDASPAPMASASPFSLPLPLPEPVPTPSPTSPAPSSASAGGASSAPRAASGAPPAALGPYAMGRAWVEIGAIDTERVRDQAVRAALKRLELGECYRAALAQRESHATGIALVNFSFDERGTAAAAVVTDTQFLPGMTACLQQRASRAALGPGAVDAGGGTATAQLVFHDEP